MEQKKHGGARQGAGRPSKVDEISLIEKMDAILVPDIAWQSLAALVQEQDHNAIKTWLSYRYGMPKQSIDHSGYIASPEKPLTPDEARLLMENLDKL